MVLVFFFSAYTKLGGNNFLFPLTPPPNTGIVTAFLIGMT